MKERIINVLQTITDENLTEKYAEYANMLKIEAGNESDKEEYMFLIEITDVLKNFMVQKYMQIHGWVQNDQDDLLRWEHH